MLVSYRPLNIYNKPSLKSNSELQKPVSFEGAVAINKIPEAGYNRVTELQRKFYMNIEHADKKELAEILQKKAKSLPHIVDSMFYNIGMYLKEDINNVEFVKRYCELTDPLYRRIAEGVEKEAFNKNYAPEIDTLVKIRQSINEFNNQIIQQSDLDSNIADLVRTYLKTPFKREQYFAK